MPMCGIAGIVAPDLAPADRLGLVRGMVERLRHRGPSGEAVWDDGECALGIARLAIVAPNQPASVLANERGDVRGVVNGEFYNYQALLDELRGRGHNIVDGPDTALLPHLYEERGADFPVAIDGMFAVALWDQGTQTLLLARDRAGEKPLFFAQSPGRFAFASEPAALVSLPWVKREPAAGALARYLLHGYFRAERFGVRGPSAAPGRSYADAAGTASGSSAATGGPGTACARAGPACPPARLRRVPARRSPLR